MKTIFIMIHSICLNVCIITPRVANEVEYKLLVSRVEINNMALELVVVIRDLGDALLAQ